MGKWLIAEWREAWRFSSLWAATVGFGALTAWNMMPPAARDLVPDWIEAVIGFSLWLAVFLARVTRQPGSQAAIDAKRTAAGETAQDWVDQAHG